MPFSDTINLIVGQHSTVTVTPANDSNVAAPLANPEVPQFNTTDSAVVVVTPAPDGLSADLFAVAPGTRVVAVHGHKIGGSPGLFGDPFESDFTVIVAAATPPPATATKFLFSFSTPA